jgi:DNA polymerase V
MSVIGLVDANNFYCSVEAAFDPELQSRPIVVLSNNDGCVVSRNIEARMLKIPMGAPAFQIRPLLEKHNGVDLSSNYTLYDDLSLRFQTALEDFSPDIEHYSIDEVFMRMPVSNWRTLTETGRKMREQVRALTGVAVSVGFGETKTLAKIAIEIAKTSTRAGGLVDLVGSPYQDEALSRVAVADVWGVGARYSEALERKGIKTALDLRDADDKWIRKRMTVVGLRTVMELRGIQCIPFDVTPKVKQQLCVSRSFGAATDSLQDLRAAVAFFTSRVAEKLREQRLLAGELSVFVATDPFKHGPKYSGNACLSVAPKSDSTLELLPLSLKALGQVYREGVQIRKAGVMLNNLELADRASRRLWDMELYELHKRLMGVVDALNIRFGKDTLRCGLFPNSGAWRARFQRRSPDYTTDWLQLMTAH